MTPLSQQLLQRVADFIAREHLFSASTEKDARCFVGFSGGPDSVALLHILHQLGYNCEALHCNFHLRGEESNRDEQFCHAFCQRLNIPLRVQSFDTRSYMENHHLSLEMAARELRYKWWKDVIEEGKTEKNENDTPQVIALGHHRDDSIETFLINLMRGTGIQGLTGIVARNESSHVIRPLLCLSRADILSYLDAEKLSYITDSTNSECDTLRNELRNHILPLMERALPQCRQGITTTQSRLFSSALFADRFIDDIDRRFTITRTQWGLTWLELSIAQIQEHIGDSRLIPDFCFEWRKRHSNNQSQVISTKDLLYTKPADETAFQTNRPQLVERLILDGKQTSVIPTNTLYTETFDYDTIALPLTLRRWQEGDRMAPLGMNSHTKLLSDLMSNAHYTPMQKATTWVVTDASGAIIWAIGLRISDNHKVSALTSKRLILGVY